MLTRQHLPHYFIGIAALFFILFVATFNPQTPVKALSSRSLLQSAMQQTVIPNQPYYVSCLLNGVGPQVDLTPFKIIDLRTQTTKTIPVGTWVWRTVDENGSYLPADSKGRLLITWKDVNYWITGTAIKQAGPDGSTDCDGYITPQPTFTPVVTTIYVTTTPQSKVVVVQRTEQPTQVQSQTQPTLAVTLPPAPTKTPHPTYEPGVTVYQAGRFDLPNTASIFGQSSPAMVGSYRFYDEGTLDLAPAELEQCIDGAPANDSSCYSPEKLVPNSAPGLGIQVYAPVDGCAYSVPDYGSIVVLVVNCEQNIVFNDQSGPIRGRREIVFTHLDPDTTKTLVGKKLTAGEPLANLCTVSNRASCDIGSTILPYLSVKVRFNIGGDYIPATHDEILALLSVPNCLYDNFLYSPAKLSPNPKSLKACPELK